MKNLLKVLIPVFCVLVSVGNAQAQTCSTTDELSLKSCIVVGTETCRAASACNDYKPALTIDDVTELAIAACCGKTAKTARSLCLVKESKKYLPLVASGSQREFFRAARAEIKRIKNSVCKNTTYSIPSDSALF